MTTDPQAFVDELVADLEPADAVELAGELTRMIELGLIELDATGDEPRIAIAVGLTDPRERPARRPRPTPRRAPARGGPASRASGAGGGR